MEQQQNMQHGQPQQQRPVYPQDGMRWGGMRRRRRGLGLVVILVVIGLLVYIAYQLA